MRPERLHARLKCLRAVVQAQDSYPECQVVYNRNGSSHMTYFVGCEVGNELYLKIGRSANLRERMDRIQVGNPFPCEPLMVSNLVPETTYHSYYGEYHTRGEWFVFEAEDGKAPILYAIRQMMYEYSGLQPEPPLRLILGTGLKVERPFQLA